MSSSSAPNDSVVFVCDSTTEPGVYDGLRKLQPVLDQQGVCYTVVEERTTECSRNQLYDGVCEHLAKWKGEDVTVIDLRTEDHVYVDTLARAWRSVTEAAGDGKRSGIASAPLESEKPRMSVILTAPRADYALPGVWALPAGSKMVALTRGGRIPDVESLFRSIAVSGETSSADLSAESLLNQFLMTDRTRPLPGSSTSVGAGNPNGFELSYLNEKFDTARAEGRDFSAKDRDLVKKTLGTGVEGLKVDWVMKKITKCCSEEKFDNEEYGLALAIMNVLEE